MSIMSTGLAPSPLQRLAIIAVVAPRRVIAIGLIVMAAAAMFGIPVTSSLSNGGFHDPSSESWQASRLLSQKFGHGDMQLLISITDEDGVGSPAARAAADEVMSTLKRESFVTRVDSAWTAPPAAAPALIGQDGKTGLIVAGIGGGEDGAQKHAAGLVDRLPQFDDVTVRLGGDVMNYIEIIDQTRKDLLMMEIIAIPLSFVVLVWVFGGLLAAALPLAVGVFAILGSMAVMRAISFATDVSVFALNLILAMGLALAIDYTLLIVSRFRDELADGVDREAALIRTMATAGRTVTFSAMTVALSMVAMAFFPMYFLKSFAYAGIAVVCFAAFAALVITPAALMMLGDRLDAYDVRRYARRLLGRPEPAQRPVEHMFWYRWTKAAMSHALPLGLAIIALLLLLGAPFLGVRWGYPDDRVLPESAGARQVADELRTGFAVNSLTDVIVVLRDTAAVSPAELARYSSELSRVPDVSSVSPTVKDGSAFLTITSTAPLYSDASETQLDRLHAITPPGPSEVQFTGWAQINRDSAHAVTSRLPLVLSVMGIITFVLLFLLTGSVVLPLKAVLLNVLSLTAAFGALVWIFQEGHLGGFGTTATGTLVASVPVLLFCLVFGLSMDYEVFLLSRIREFWLASDRTSADNSESVARGLARTGRVVTAAALLMAVTFAALMAAEVSVMRMMGLGVTLAVLVDATLVRMVLVPAFMRVLGRANWWAPGPLVRLHRRFGLSEEPLAAEPRRELVRGRQ